MNKVVSSAQTSGSCAKAFTLIELIVAMLMLAVLATATYAAISQTARARDKSLARTTAFTRASIAVDVIAADAENALRDANLTYAKVSITHAGKGHDGLTLFSHILRTIRPSSTENEGDECESQFRLQPSTGAAARSGASTLWRRQQPVPDDVTDGGGVASTIVDGISDLTITAYDGSSWTDTWDSDTDGLPHALRIAITAIDDDNRANITLRRTVALDRVPIPPESTTTGTSTSSSSTGGTP